MNLLHCPAGSYQGPANAEGREHELSNLVARCRDAMLVIKTCSGETSGDVLRLTRGHTHANGEIAWCGDDRGCGKHLEKRERL